MIENNPHVFEKRLFSELGYGDELRVLTANNEEHEAERVAGELIAHHFINKTNYKDYAILYRGNHQSRIFEKYLMQNRIPYRISGETSFSHEKRSKIFWPIYESLLILMMMRHFCVL